MSPCPTRSAMSPCPTRWRPLLFIVALGVACTRCQGSVDLDTDGEASVTDARVADASLTDAQVADAPTSDGDVAPGCSSDSCSGCCRAGSCIEALTDEACGRAGGPCVDCLSMGQVCTAAAECCAPACEGKPCGAADGCGGSCAAGSGCCTPDCASRTCGEPDACGTLCDVGSGCACPGWTIATGTACEDRLVAVSYNIAGGTQLYGDPEPVLRRLATMIKNNSADLVGLQEMELDSSWHGHVDMHARLLAILREIGYPMVGTFDKRLDFTVPPYEHTAAFGLSLLSRRPILRHEVLPITFPDRTYEPVILQRATVQYGARAVVFHNYHTSPAEACDATASTSFMGEIAGSTAPPSQRTSIIAGDFNLFRSAPCYPPILNAGYTDVCTAAGDGTCLLTVDPRVRPDLGIDWSSEFGIDYLFFRPAPVPPGEASRWRVDATWTWYGANDFSALPPLIMSDHFPVISELRRAVDFATPACPASLTTHYDFIANAPAANWHTASGAVIWNAQPPDAGNGIAEYRDATTEDGVPRQGLLFAHPEGQPHGFVHGGYSVTLPPKPTYLALEVGFVSGADVSGCSDGATLFGTDGVTFSVDIYQNGQLERIFEATKPYNGILATASQSGCATLPIPSKYAGSAVSFFLNVDAGSSASCDWAVWREARLLTLP